MSSATSPAPVPSPPSALRISRAERAVLAIERGLDRWLTPLGIWAYRRTKGGIARPWKRDVLLLTTRGRRSGRVRTVVLRFFRDGDLMIVAAANDGGRSHPGWYFNLVAEPAAAVEVNGRPIDVFAEVLPFDASTAWWERVVEQDPGYERFARATDRNIPIVRLTPVEPGAIEPSPTLRPDPVPLDGPVVRPIVGQALLALSGSGFPLTQAVIRRFGRRGALAAEGVCLGLLIRDGALIVGGAPARLRRGPAALLFLETAAAGVASVAGLAPMFDQDGQAGAARVTPVERVRRAAVASLFGLHTLRLRLYLGRDRGRRTSVDSRR